MTFFTLRILMRTFNQQRCIVDRQAVKQRAVGTRYPGVAPNTGVVSRPLEHKKQLS